MKNIERKAYRQLLSWKNELADRYALLVEGARRVGKTYLIRTFVENEYETFIYIDFSLKTVEVNKTRQLFKENGGIGDLLQHLQLLFSITLIPGKSCIVFDEVQLFPPAREAIKHLIAYGKYHYIESGSLVGIHENVRDILVPSEEHRLKIYPLDFEEFLGALGKTEWKKHVDDPVLHDSVLSLFRLYMIVGGMPQSVLAYLDAPEESRLEACERAKREILQLYDSDIGKYARGYASKVRAIFRTIPSALNRHEKMFHLADIDTNARMRRYENAFLWLADAMVVNIAYNATSPDLGLGMSLDTTTYKCYYADTGLLVTAAMGAGKTTDPRILRGILRENIGINEGMFFENAVAQILTAKGDDLLFYSRKDKKDSSNTMEIDFLVSRGLKVCPVEVKSSHCRRHASLDRFIEKFGRFLGRKYVVCTELPAADSGVDYIPIYRTYSI